MQSTERRKWARCEQKQEGKGAVWIKLKVTRQKDNRGTKPQEDKEQQTII